MGRTAARAATCLLLALACASSAAGGYSAPSLEGIPLDGRTRQLLAAMAAGRSLAEQAGIVISNSDSYPGIVTAAPLNSCGGKYRLALQIAPQFAGLYRVRVKARGVAVAPPTNTAPSVTASGGEQGPAVGCVGRSGCTRAPTAAAPARRLRRTLRPPLVPCPPVQTHLPPLRWSASQVRQRQCRSSRPGGIVCICVRHTRPALDRALLPFPCPSGPPQGATYAVSTGKVVVSWQVSSGGQRCAHAERQLALGCAPSSASPTPQAALCWRAFLS